MTFIKTVTGVTFLLLSAIALGNSDYRNTKIIGKWRYFGFSGNDGAKNYINKSPDSINRYLIFYKNGILGGNYFKNGPRHYQLKKHTLIVKSNNQYVIKYLYGIDKKTLYLGFTENMCDEGCAEVFTKVTNP
ncbi:hypothetical protein [Mucilaginibacter psychrotolerans]|uniref:Lipocalin-like domain-containing protein n=1 Tax=Mucilaginibacter psychrotolerans TaxID=1524096 RepID=A0A4Y8SK98_9SPHI|nr:hypothetical protein [Mucilaginibacter psychrotolerans]TFF38864.1 hypothetical protein E2R66_07620 [Mucilaginibacter psychrotolerans]